jgi:HSP20 family molecular chaperone IbpA
VVENWNEPVAQGRDLNNHVAVSWHNAEIEKDKLQKPFVEVIEMRDNVIILVEIHGYRGSDMKVRTDGSQLNIHASSDKSSWNSTLTLPTAIDPRDSTARYNNGTLEVTLRKGYYSVNGFVLIELI